MSCAAFRSKAFGRISGNILGPAPDPEGVLVCRELLQLQPRCEGMELRVYYLFIIFEEPEHIHGCTFPSSSPGVWLSHVLLQGLN